MDGFSAPYVKPGVAAICTGSSEISMLKVASRVLALGKSV